MSSIVIEYVPGKISKLIKGKTPVLLNKLKYCPLLCVDYRAFMIVYNFTEAPKW
jgi:hypothetical protein